ncbi:MIP/aquaporin family protein [Phytoactinopolyspora halotolerans]|uniref:MIP/aquaporin family protein n=1 Tax=Phytoactinopolyspora halotolerans TaxID=1981512 RepID=UPI0015766873|nr:MIP/aquaporin family protein [Phytoactinopolyspora halotolerans]
MDLNFGEIFYWELLGTGMLVLLGCGVVANVILPRNKGYMRGPLQGNWLLINFGWGLGVFAGVYVAAESGAHINPAVTFGLAVEGTTEWSDVPAYLLGQMTGAFLGAVVMFLAYKLQFDAGEEPDLKLGVFSTGPEVRSYPWNFITEVVGTFVLVFVVLSFGPHPIDIGPLAVALLVVGIGASLGGPTGYAINPARDLGPRIAHALLPIKGKGSSDWGYSWVPIAGPIVGGVLAGLLGAAVF